MGHILSNTILASVRTPAMISIFFRSSDYPIAGVTIRISDHVADCGMLIACVQD